MPFAFLFFGVLILVTAIKGNQNALAAQVVKDFTGSGKFFYWIGAIIILAAIGRAVDLPGASKMLITLIIVVYLVSQPGIFGQFSTGLAGVAAPAASSTNAVGAQVAAAN